MKGWLKRAALSLLLLILVLAAGFIAYLASPGIPSASGSLRFVGYIPLPRGGAFNVLDYMNVEGNRLYVADLSSGSVVRIPLHERGLSNVAEEAVLQGAPQVHGAVIGSGAGFVSREGQNTVDVFDPETMTLRKSLPTADDPDGMLYDPDDKLVYVASGDGMAGTLVDAVSQTVTGRVSLGGRAEYPVYDTAAKQIFQNLESTNEVVSIDPRLRTVTGRWKLDDREKPSGAALDAAQQRLWIACGGNSKAVGFDLSSHKVVALMPVGSKPDTIAYDPVLRRAYAAGVFGVTTVLEQTDAGTYRVRDSVRTHPLVHTLAIDPATHRVYIGYAVLLGAPRVAVFEALP